VIVRKNCRAVKSRLRIEDGKSYGNDVKKKFKRSDETDPEHF
jgi:hypothetical protein